MAIGSQVHVSGLPRGMSRGELWRHMDGAGGGATVTRVAVFAHAGSDEAIVAFQSAKQASWLPLLLLGGGAVFVEWSRRWQGSGMSAAAAE